MTGRIVYVGTAPSFNRNVELDRVAESLGRDTIKLIYLAGENVRASAPHTLPQVCDYYCVDRPNDRLGGARPELQQLITDLDPTHVVVSGYAERDMRRAIWWCLRNNVPYSLRTDGSIWTDDYKGRLRQLVRRMRLTPRVALAHSCLIGGKTNREFWIRYGMKPHQERWWPQWIDYDHYAKARKVDSAERQALREEYGIGTYPNFLYVGRHVALKNIDRLCEGLLRCEPNVGLILIGRGPETVGLVEKYGARLSGRLHIVGLKTHEELPKWYAASDAFVLATGARENWGMVVNEATAAGLPMICDEKVGSVPDLVVNGRNGVTLRTNSAEEWGEVMRSVSAKPERLEEMGRESAIISDDWKARSDPIDCVRPLLEV